MHSTLKNFFNENNKNISFNNFNNYFFDVNQNMDNYLLNVTSAKSVNLQNKLTDGDILSSVEDFNLLKNCNNFMHLDEKSFDKQSYEYLFSKFPETQALLLSKLYIPKPFNASPSNVYNGLPWFLDFVHLSFWFFFLSIVVSVLFLIYFFNFIWNNQENKYPIRETRGFSRAQTGDTMTAIIPMTWSITMLLHASTHSSNFDENTTGTQFCLTVIAYQWGWNYYYPKDIIGIFNSTPIKVGHDNVDYYSNFNDNYATLLDISRNQILNKNFYLGVGSSKVGKSNIQTLQSLFFKPFGSNQNLELPVSLFINLNSKNNNADKTLSAEIKRYVRSVDAALVNYTYNNNDSVNINNININNTNNVNFNFFSFLLYNKFNVLNFYKNLNLSFYKNFEFNIFYNKINNFNTLLNQQVISNIHHKQFLSSSSLKVKAIDSHRNKNTFFSNSNKLLLVFKSMTQDYNKQYANKKLINIEDSSLRFVEINNQYSIVQNHINQFSVFNNLTLEDFNTITLNSLYSMNLTINQWLNFNNYNFYNNNQLQWNNFLTFNFLTFNTKGFYLLNKKNINLNDNFQNIFFFFYNKYNILNFKKIFQLFSTVSPDNSFLFFSNSILNFEDLGFVDSLAIKEFWYKNTMSSNFFYFNIIKFYKSSFFNTFNFSFINYSKNKNFKFWEFDASTILAQQSLFQQNFTISNENQQFFNILYTYYWPSLVSDISKNFNNIFLTYISIYNLLNSSYYNLRLNYLLVKDFTVNNYFNSININNKNKNVDIEIFFFNNKDCKFLLLKSYSFIFNKFKSLLNIILLDDFLIRYESNFNKYFNTLKVSETKPILKNFKNLNFFSVNVVKNNEISALPLFKFKINFKFKLNINRYLNSFYFFKNKMNLIRYSEIYNYNINNLFWDIFFKKVSNGSLFYSEKPIRISLKFNDPINFNFKFSSEILNIFYVNKNLFLWQMSWSNAMKIYKMPLYKFYRGNVEKKLVSGYLDYKNVNSFFSDESITDNYKSSILKNFYESKRDRNYWSKMKNHSFNRVYSQLIDSEKVNFFRNYVVYLPNVNDDLDVNYISKYLNFDLNISRRNDHLSKFKVFWGPLFIKYLRKLVATDLGGNNLIDSLNIKNINFFKSYTIKTLLFDSFYIQNISLQKNYYITSLKAFSKYSSIRINFLKSNFFWNFNVLTFNSLEEIKNIKCLFTNANNSTTWFINRNNLNSYFYYNSNFLNYWLSIWFFKDNLQNFSNKIFFNKNFKDNLDLTNKINLILSFKDKEFKNILHNQKFKKSLLNFNNDLIVKDFLSVCSLYQNNFDIKNNTLNNNQTTLIFNNLDFFKYYNSIVSNSNFIKSFKSVYYNYYILQLQKSFKSRFDFKEINNNIPNMRRLRVSKGICLPSDFSIHIICASKDVIHSWAIPGLGIKIDAIPGFNSHRRILFRWRGLYWGQCMEVCGRYHHWMPILIRIVHKDLFLVWCLSYLRVLNNKNFKYEKFFFDEILLSNWISDSSNSMLLTNFYENILNKNNSEARLLFLETQLLMMHKYVN